MKPEKSWIERHRAGWLLVAVQFACLFWFILKVEVIRLNGLMVLQLAGLTLGVAAVWSMRRSRLRIAPEPDARASLVRSGVYRYLRHPMYTALLLVFLPPAIVRGQWPEWLAAALLLLDLVLKLHYEERLLRRQFPEYVAYQQESWRLFPFLY